MDCWRDGDGGAAAVDDAGVGAAGDDWDDSKALHRPEGPHPLCRRRRSSSSCPCPLGKTSAGLGRASDRCK